MSIPLLDLQWLMIENASPKNRTYPLALAGLMFSCLILFAVGLYMASQAAQYREQLEDSRAEVRQWQALVIRMLDKTNTVYETKNVPQEPRR